jgi:hypothetical protein
VQCNVVNSFYKTFPLYLEKWTINPKLSQEIRSSEKYKTSAQDRKPTPSTLAGNV